MKIKKLLSLCAAMAVTASTTICVTPSIANAIDVGSAEVGTIYKAGDLFSSTNDSNSISGTNDFSTDQNGKNYSYTENYTNLGEPFGTISWSADDAAGGTYPKYSKTSSETATLTYNITEAGAYVFNYLTAEYNNRYPDIYLDDVQKIDGDSYSIANSNKVGYTGSREIGIIQISATLTAGTHTIKMDTTQGLSSNSKNVGSIAAVLLKGETVAVTDVSIPQNRANLKEGSTMTLTASVSPTNATTSDVTWTTSDSSVVSIESSTGSTVTIKGVSGSTGTGKSATITATSTDGTSISGTATVYVIASSGWNAKPDTVESSTVYPASPSYFAKDDSTKSGFNYQTNANTIYNYDSDLSDNTVKYVFGNGYGTMMDDSYIGNYYNFIGNSNGGTYTGVNMTIPSLAAGTYKIYYVGGNNYAVTATVDDTALTESENGAQKLAACYNTTGGVNTLYYREFDLTTTAEATDYVINFNNSSTWLPDLYAVAVVKMVEEGTPETEKATLYTSEEYTGTDIGYTASHEICKGDSTMQWFVNDTANLLGMKYDVSSIEAGSTVKVGLVITGYSELNEEQKKSIDDAEFGVVIE